METKRMKFTEFSSKDVNYLVDLDSDLEVMRYITGKVTPLNEAQQQLERILAMQKRYSGAFGYWLAFDRQSDEFLGWFHFRPAKNALDDLQRIELGYRLKKKFWSKGLATEGSEFFIERGFQQQGVASVFAITMKSNLASQAVMKKCGLQFVREFQDIHFPDSAELDVEYCLKKSEYLS